MLHLTPVLENNAPAVPFGAMVAIPSAVKGWDTSCLDWEERLLAGRSLVPELPLFEAEAAQALRVFKRLRVPDVIGTPTLGEVCGQWFFPIVAALFGAYDPETNIRHISRSVSANPEGQRQVSPTAAR